MSNSKFNANPKISSVVSSLPGLDDRAKTMLTLNLTRVVNGNSDNLITPIARRFSSPKVLLSKWDEVYNSIISNQDENKPLVNHTLREIETAQRLKFSPRSISKPWTERREDVDNYFENPNLDYTKLECESASSSVGRLRPLSINQAAKFIKRGTNSGIPFMTDKGSVLDEVISDFNFYLERRDPCVLFTRTQEAGKTRNVWGYPLADVLNEMRFYRPILDVQKSLSWRSALSGPTSVDIRATEILKTAIRDGLLLISIDFSSYDASIKQGLQFRVGHYYKSLFQKQFHGDIDKIIERKSTIGLVTPDGILDGPHGVPSGSVFTNEDDSIAQYCIAKESNSIKDGLFEIQGDDGIYAVSPDSKVSLYSSFTKYGLNVNEEKSLESDNHFVFLQMLYHPYYDKGGVIGGIYPLYRALNRIAFQERWSRFEDYGLDGVNYYSLRTLSILENCKNHPLFEQFVEFIWYHDKYSLEYNQSSISDYVRLIKDTEGRFGVVSNQYGDDINGISDWASVAVVRRLNS